MLRHTFRAANATRRFDVEKAAKLGYYKPVSLKSEQENLIKEDQTIFQQSSWTFSRREHLSYNGVPYYDLPVVRVQARLQNLVFTVWTNNQNQNTDELVKFSGEWRGDNIVWNNPWWRRKPVKRIDSEKEENLAFLHRPELFWSCNKSGYLKEGQRRDLVHLERTAADFATNALNSKQLNSDSVRLIIQGYNLGREASIVGMTSAGLKLASITDDTRAHQRDVDGYGMQRAKQRRWRKGWSSKIGKRD